MKIHKEMYYFETKEVRPSRDDADKAYEILAWNGYYWARVYYKNLHIDPIDNEDPAEFYTHWMQMPKAPDVNDKEF